VPHVDVEETREAVDDAPTVGEVDPDALAARDDAGSLHLVLAKFGDRVDEVCAI